MGVQLTTEENDVICKREYSSNVFAVHSQKQRTIWPFEDSWVEKERINDTVRFVKVSDVTEIPPGSFGRCMKLEEVEIGKGVNVIGFHAFRRCEALQKVTLSSWSVTELSDGAFCHCSNLQSVHLNVGLQTVGNNAFYDCSALTSVTIPSTVCRMDLDAFEGCINLTEVVFLGGRFCYGIKFLQLINSGDKVLLDQESFNEILEPRIHRVFRHCTQLTDVKVSISWAVAERILRLSPECRQSIEEKICDLPRIDRQCDHILAVFTVAIRDGAVSHLLDTGNVAARSLFQIFRLIAFHELREASIVIDLAMWRARIEDAKSELSREDCRITVPGPARSLIMEYGGFAGFL